jgi:hypothetical protein
MKRTRFTLPLLLLNLSYRSDKPNTIEFVLFKKTSASLVNTIFQPIAAAVMG